MCAIINSLNKRLKSNVIDDMRENNEKLKKTNKLRSHEYSESMSSDLLDKKLAIAWGIVILSTFINVAAGWSIACLYPIGSRPLWLLVFPIMILLSFSGYVFYESRLRCNSLGKKSDDN